MVEKRHGESLWYDVNYKGRTIKKHAETMKKRLVPVIELQKQKMTGPEEIRERKNIEQPEITKIPQASAGSSTSRESESGVSCNPPTQQLRRSERLGAKPKVMYNADTGFVKS